MNELYDEICKILTWYEYPDEYPFGKEECGEDINDMMYEMLVKVANTIESSNIE